MNQAYFGCSQREVRVNLQAVQSNAEFFKRLTTTANIDEQIRRKANLVGKDHCLELRYAGARRKIRGEIFRTSKENQIVSPAGATLYIDDNSLPSEDFESRGELSDALAQIVLKKNSMCP